MSKAANALAEPLGAPGLHKLREEAMAAARNEPGYVTIPVRLEGNDLRNVRRILGGKYEPEVNAWLCVKVRRKK